MGTKRNLLQFVLFAILLLALCAGCGTGSGFQHISPDEAQRMMQAGGNVLVVDVRTEEEYDKRHIPGAILLPIEDIRQGKLEALPDKDQSILLYCWTGRRAEDSAVMLANHGYRHVYEFGGLVDWTGEIVGKEAR